MGITIKKLNILNLLLIISAVGCGSGSEDTTSTGATTVTVGVYRQETDLSFTDTGYDLVFEVGAVCETWDRTTNVSDSFSSTTHLHYNAANDSSYDGSTFHWTEYGPEHSLADVEATCAAGTGGVTKAVDSVNYYEDHPGVFLRIK